MMEDKMKLRGTIFTVLGAVAALFGYNSMNSLDYKLSSAFGQLDSSEEILISVAFYGGIALFIIGLVMLISAIAKSKKD